MSTKTELDPWGVKVNSRYVPVEYRIESVLLQRHNAPISPVDLAAIIKAPRREIRAVTMNSRKFVRVRFRRVPGVWIRLRRSPDDQI